MIAYTSKKIEHLLKLEFIRFCIVGGTGFVINLVILTGLHKGLRLASFPSQLIGAEIALFSNFMLHHHWTYKHRKVQKTMTSLLIQFHATTWPAIFGSAAMVSLAEKALHLSDLSALIIASAVALLWNFGWSKFVIWRDVTPKETEEMAE